MKIEDKLTMEFGKIKEGECFVEERTVYLKSEPSINNDGKIISNCVSILDGEISYFGDDWIVTKVNAKLVCE